MDGISLTIGGTALTVIGGIAGAWIKAWSARHQKTEISPNPLSVEQTAYQAAMKDNAGDHANLFDRVRALEKQHAALDAKVDAKFDAISEQLRETKDMVRQLFERICNGRRK